MRTVTSVQFLYLREAAPRLSLEWKPFDQTLRGAMFDVCHRVVNDLCRSAPLTIISYRMHFAAQCKKLSLRHLKKTEYIVPSRLI